MTGRGMQSLRGVVSYVRQTWPHFNRTGGARHLVVMTNDKGATFIRGGVPALERATFITQWGWKRPHIHRPGLDIVVPPMLKVAQLLRSSPYVSADGHVQPRAAAALAAPPRYLLSFVGSIRLKNRGYSFGVRQMVYRTHNATAGFFLRDLRGDSKFGVHKALPPREYMEVLQSSKFCLAPAGMGFSTRVYEAAVQGCVPLIIQNEDESRTDVDQAFEELLPYSNFSLRLEKKDVPQLPTILAQVPQDRWLQMRANLGCVWPRLLWLHGAGAGRRRSGLCGSLCGVDAWETLMATLQHRAARRRGVAPEPFSWVATSASCARVPS